jgi:CDP-2,3-bis-(O-geranylgeranyl)-sn-glycerol synthase
MDLVRFCVGALWWLLPAGAANTVPVLLRRVPVLGAPIDGGRTYRGQPIFGANKTWRGFIAAPLAGWAVALGQVEAGDLFPPLRAIALASGPAWWGAVLGAGAISGDLIKSFFKRRVGVPAGASWVPCDQLDWVVGAVAALSWWYVPGWWRALGLLVVGGLAHVSAVALGRLIGLRRAWI